MEIAISRKHPPFQSSSNRSFGLLFCCFFLFLAFLPLLHHHSVRIWSVVVSLVFLILALARPQFLQPLNRAWLYLSVLLSKVTTPIMMGIIFYLVLTPIGLSRRLFKKDSLVMGFESMKNTYWIQRKSPGFQPKEMRNQF